MTTSKGFRSPAGRRRRVVPSILWSAALAVVAWFLVSSWGFTFWPTVAFFAACTAGVVIPLGLTLGMLIPWRQAFRKLRQAG